MRNSLGFAQGQIPFTYLGVPIFKGKPKVAHLQPITDKIKTKLATWKGSLLSIMGTSTGKISYQWHAPL